MVADLLLRIQELEEENEKLKEENDKLKEPNGLELAMREEWEKYELVLRQNWQRDLSDLIKRVKANEKAWININEVKRKKYNELLKEKNSLEAEKRYNIMDSKL
mgnify:CR=1 FL=1